MLVLKYFTAKIDRGCIFPFRTLFHVSINYVFS